MDLESKSELDDDVAHWIRTLESLTEGELAISALTACGARATGPLRNFLLYGHPSTVFQPRQRAVRALAELGAAGVLTEYLRMDKAISDPAVRFAEEAVENTAARALGQWKTDEVYNALLATARERRLVGVVEALGEFGRPEAVPFLIAALEDDICRHSAEDALRHLGSMAQPALIETARTPDPSGTNERPSSLRRRRSAMRILADISLVECEWPRLQALLYEKDAEIVVAACRIALRLATPAEQLVAVDKLIGQLPVSDWLLEAEIEDVLLAHYDLARSAIEKGLAARRNMLQVQGHDHVSDVLLAIQNRAESRYSS
jgi:HEAT repeat protein